ncbi:MAG: hypothetical protein IPK82_20415 [Polyangiaceae bacterium]|nr:hypothetical protein [Polyangiaceae bacterium]
MQIFRFIQSSVAVLVSIPSIAYAQAPVAPPAGAEVSPPAPPAYPYTLPPGSIPGLAVPAGQGIALLHIDTVEPAVALFRKGGDDPICVAPCDRLIDGRTGGQFFFGGIGVNRSKTFTLMDRPPNVSIHVDAGYRAQRIGGLLMAAFSGAGALSGGALLLAGQSDATTLVGGIAIGTNLAMVVVGVIVANTCSTKYTFARTSSGTLGFRF